MHSPAAFQKRILKEKIDTKEILMGEEVVETVIKSYKLQKWTQSIVEDSIPVFARRIKLLEIRQKLLKEHEDLGIMKSYSDEYYESLPIEVRAEMCWYGEEVTTDIDDESIKAETHNTITNKAPKSMAWPCRCCQSWAFPGLGECNFWPSNLLHHKQDETKGGVNRCGNRSRKATYILSLHVLLQLWRTRHHFMNADENALLSCKPSWERPVEFLTRMLSGSFMEMVLHSRLKQELKWVAHTPALDVQLVVPCLMM